MAKIYTPVYQRLDLTFEQRKQLNAHDVTVERGEILQLEKIQSNFCLIGHYSSLEGANSTKITTTIFRVLKL
jgi:hypothetical protein